MTISMTKTRGMALAALFAVLTAVASWLKIPTGLMAITMLYLGTALSGAVLGPKWGAVSQLVYVLLGLVGLPFFTKGGGFWYVLEPSFGFVLGLIPAAAVVGALRGDGQKPLRLLAASAAGLGVLYLVGLPYMYLILNVYLGQGMPVRTLVWAGMVVYLPGDALKLVITALLAPVLNRALRRA